MTCIKFNEYNIDISVKYELFGAVERLSSIKDLATKNS